MRQVDGLQVATNQSDEGSEAVALARASGMSYIDLNCGCLREGITRGGLGSRFLNAQRIANEVESACAAVLTMHGLTKEQRYAKVFAFVVVVFFGGLLLLRRELHNTESCREHLKKELMSGGT